MKFSGAHKLFLHLSSRNDKTGFSFAPLNVYAARRMSTLVKTFGVVAIAILLACAACSGNNDNSHTTATTFVTPSPRQVLRAESRPGKLRVLADPTVQLDGKKPLLELNLPEEKTFREGEQVVIDFSLANAKLKGDGGEFRVRYIVDDDEMKWIDRWEQVVLTGWIAGKHTIRVELVGPDGWPLRDNIVTREITIIK